MTRPTTSYRDHPAFRELTFDEMVELIIGEGRVPGESEPTSDFESDEIRREAWFAHRSMFMDDPPSSSYSRPFGWWRYEAREDPPDSRVAGAEKARLIELGEIVDDEEETP